MLKITANIILGILLIMGGEVFAMDSIAHRDTIYQHADTFKLQEQQAISGDGWLLDILADKSQGYYDSIRVEQQRLQDSIESSQLLQLLEARKADTLMHSIMVQMPQVQIAAISARELDNWKDDIEELRAELRSRQSHWYREGNIMLQFTQSYASSNWYTGGSPASLTLIGKFKGRISYIHNNIAWENYLDWRNGIATTPADSLRMYNITDDLFRLNSKFGYQIIKKLYFSTSVDLQLNLWNTWKTNEKILQSAFMTPLIFNLNSGLDYKPIEGLSIVFGPINYRLVFALQDEREGVDVTNYGIKSGKDILHEFGSSIRAHYKHKLIREIYLDTEFYFYTNYRGVQIDWEVNFDFKINRFLSAQVMVRPRFDNTNWDPGRADKPKIQFKDLVSIGFSHKFY